VVWTAWYENTAGDPPSSEDLDDLEAFLGLTHTVLADPEHRTDALFDPEDATRPTWVLVEPGGEVLHAGPDLSEAEVVAALP
jgi:hypothetical protein